LHNRNFIGMEISEEYTNLSLKRLKLLENQLF